jgi:hypothetical protein
MKLSLSRVWFRLLLFLACVFLLQISGPRAHAGDPPPDPPPEEVPLEPPPDPPAPDQEKAPEPKFDQTVDPPLAPEEQTAPPPESSAPMPTGDDPAPGSGQAETVPPEQPEQELPPPPAPVIAAFSSEPDAAEIQRIIPQVEVWRAGASLAQKPARQSHCTKPVYVTGNQSVMVRLQFDPLSSGKLVMITEATNITLDSGEADVHINPTGECIVSLRLDEDVRRGHVTFWCDGLDTTVPFLRASQAMVEAQEAATGGG